MQQEKLQKLVLNITVGLSLGIAAAIAIFLICGNGAPSAKSLADFKTWEAQQTRQEGRGAVQTDQVTP